MHYCILYYIILFLCIIIVVKLILYKNVKLGINLHLTFMFSFFIAKLWPIKYEVLLNHFKIQNKHILFAITVKVNTIIKLKYNK